MATYHISSQECSLNLLHVCVTLLTPDKSKHGVPPLYSLSQYTNDETKVGACVQLTFISFYLSI